ncbi:AhpC/TSA family protein [Pedobacter hiemivivus]|uniref:AhpC/TSA family protein n=1 Tax=Pedobacter hiemivivus TaxID=2530454 RepID=A0A4U1GHI4_9SPHI|nr:TlpA disulfide reductase family protein [Pedobacter hiemivivus]TKC63695.1 AhpC/TSA family protein [Pedobacter hiemivivus]
MRNILFVVLFFAPVLLLAQKQNSYKVTGVLPDTNIKWVYLNYSTGEADKPRINDSVEVINNTYTFSHQINGCTLALLQTKATSDGMIVIVLAPETIVIHHNGKFSNTTVTGSPLNDDFKAMNATFAKTENTEIFADYIRKNPSSLLSLNALRRYAFNGYKIDIEKAKPLFMLLPSSIRDSEEGKRIAQSIEYTEVFNSVGKIGTLAKDFTLLDTAGKPQSLSSFKGRYVLLDFWASWCSPCRADNPHLKTAYSKYHSQGFDILSVSLDKGLAKSQWLKAIHDDGISNWFHVADLNNDVNTAVKLYGIQGIPQNFLIDPNGKIIALSLRGGALEEELNKIYKK